MTLPGDTGFSGEDAAKHFPVEIKNEDRDAYPEEGCSENPSGKKKAEVAKDQAAGSDVVGGTWAECPKGDSTHKNDEHRTPQEDLASSDQDDAAED